MGNSCGTSTVNRIVTLGGVRKSHDANAKTVKAKTNARKDAKRTKPRKEKQNKAMNIDKNQSVEDNKQDENKKVKKIEMSKSKTIVNVNNQIQNEIIAKDRLSTKNCDSKTSTERNINEVTHNTVQTKGVPSNNLFVKRRNGNDKKRFGDDDDLSSDFNSSLSSSRQSLLLSSKHLKSEKFKANWHREEKRLQMEYNTTEQQIKNSQRDELRAKAETQTWRDKLDRLSVEHRKRLFKQAQSLHSRLHNAEKLLTYHEIRAKKLQMKNDRMKELISSVKEEAKNLRIESQKRREVTQKFFDEKFSTVEKQLTKLKARIGDTNVSNLSPDPPTKFYQENPSWNEGNLACSTKSQDFADMSHGRKPQSYSRHFKSFEVIAEERKCHSPLFSSTYRNKNPHNSETDSLLPPFVNSTPTQSSQKLSSRTSNSSSTASQHRRGRKNCIAPENKTPSNFTSSEADHRRKEIENEGRFSRSKKVQSCQNNNTKPSTCNSVNEMLSRVPNCSPITARLNSHASTHCSYGSKNSDYEGSFQSSAGSSVLMKLFQRSSATSAVSSNVSQHSVKFFNR